MDDVHYCVKGKPHPNVAEQLLVYIGVNNEEVNEDMEESTKDENDFRKKHEVEVDKVYTPTSWIGSILFRIF